MESKKKTKWAMDWGGCATVIWFFLGAVGISILHEIVFGSNPKYTWVLGLLILFLLIYLIRKEKRRIKKIKHDNNPNNES